MTKNIYNIEQCVSLLFTSDADGDDLKTQSITFDLDKDGPVEPLTEDEFAELEEREKCIDENLLAFYEVGASLFNIKSKRLYKAKYRSFKAYCSDRWGFTSVHADRLISAHKTDELLRTQPIGVTKPATESQSRTLNGLDSAQKVEVCKKVKEAHGDNPTAADFKKIRDQVSPNLSKRAVGNAKSKQSAKAVGDNIPNNALFSGDPSLKTLDLCPVVRWLNEAVAILEDREEDRALSFIKKAKAELEKYVVCEQQEAA